MQIQKQNYNEMIYEKKTWIQQHLQQRVLPHVQAQVLVQAQVRAQVQAQEVVERPLAPS